MFFEFPIVKIISELDRDNLLPAIIFRTSRAQCDQDIRKIAANKSLQLPKDQQKKIKSLIRGVADKYDMDFQLIDEHPQYQSLMSYGIGAHHAGQLIVWRLVLEELMSAGALRLMIATGTVAAGVDFPARSVVITAHSKRGATGFETLTSSEFQQMSGRAGRRGKDTVGFCIAAPSKFCDPREIIKLYKSPPEPLKSSYFPSPSTVLNLLRYRNVDDLKFTVQRSLAAFYDKKSADKLRFEADKLDDVPELEESEEPISPAEKRRIKKVRRLRKQADVLDSQQQELIGRAISGLQELGYLEGETLSKKGYWASNISTNLVLELGEIIEAGVVDNPTHESLIAVIAAISSEGRRKYLAGNLSPLTNEEMQTVVEIVERVRSIDIPGVLEETEISQNAANTVLSWMQAKDWSSFRSLLKLAGIQEGDVARLITQTAEHLNQLSRLVDSHPDIAVKAEKARLRILRPPLTEVIESAIR